NRRNQWVSLQGTACEALACSGGSTPHLRLVPLRNWVPERLPLGISVEGNPSPSLNAAPVVKNPPRKAHKDP
ncbi:Hypothetical protein FKW44_012476, partial [Caligus rogercresseyi]